eukprot:3004993-Pleurochrysis_carterae.AAC.1
MFANPLPVSTNKNAANMTLKRKHMEMALDHHYGALSALQNITNEMSAVDMGQHAVDGKTAIGQIIKELEGTIRNMADSDLKEYDDRDDDTKALKATAD